MADKKTIIYLLLSLFIYEIAVVILAIVLVLALLKSRGSLEKLLVVIFSICLMSLIIVNDKTLNFPDHEHLIKSLLFQLKDIFLCSLFF